MRWRDGDTCRLSRCASSISSVGRSSSLMVSRSTGSFELFARRTVILASAMHRQWADADPAGLSDEDLEAGYKGLVGFVREKDSFGGTLRDLIYRSEERRVGKERRS